MKETHFVITGWIIVSILLFITYRTFFTESLIKDIVYAIFGGGNFYWLVLILKLTGINNRFFKPNKEDNA